MCSSHRFCISMTLCPFEKLFVAIDMQENITVVCYWYLATPMSCVESKQKSVKIALLWYISDMNQSMSTFKRKLVDIEAALNALYFTTHLLEEKLQGNSSTGNNANHHFHFTCINSTFDRNASLAFLQRKPGFHKNKWYIFANVFPEAKMITLSAYLN